jgi:hypothetical protein
VGSMSPRPGPEPVALLPMRRGIVHWVLGLAVFAALLTGCGSSDQDGEKTPSTSVQQTAACADQSQASFHPPGADDISFGPLRFAGLRAARQMTATDLRQSGGQWKSPALLEPGHTVTVSIDPSARSFARLSYVHRQSDPSTPVFATVSNTVRFVSCSATKARSEVVPGNWSGGSAPASLPGKPVTFWSGRFHLKELGRCIPLTIQIDREALRHWRLPVGVDSCPKT